MKCNKEQRKKDAKSQHLKLANSTRSKTTISLKKKNRERERDSQIRYSRMVQWSGKGCNEISNRKEKS